MGLITTSFGTWTGTLHDAGLRHWALPVHFELAQVLLIPVCIVPFALKLLFLKRFWNFYVIGIFVWQLLWGREYGTGCILLPVVLKLAVRKTTEEEKREYHPKPRLKNLLEIHFWAFTIWELSCLSFQRSFEHWFISKVGMFNKILLLKPIF